MLFIEKHTKMNIYSEFRFLFGGGDNDDNDDDNLVNIVCQALEPVAVELYYYEPIAARHPVQPSVC